MTDFEKLPEAEQKALLNHLEVSFRKERDSFPRFVKTFFRMIHGEEFLWGEMHDYINNKLMDFIDNPLSKIMIVNLPPRHGKTLFITHLFALWWMGNHQEHEVILSGYNKDLLNGFSLTIREWYSSKFYRAIFPYRAPIKDGSNTKQSWRYGLKGGLMTTSPKAMLIGKGANLFIIDDPVNPEMATISSKYLDDVNRWFSQTAYNRLNRGFGKFIIVMQRIHENDLSGHLLNMHKKAFDLGRNVHVRLPAIAEETGYDWRKKGDALHTKIKTTEELRDIKFSMNYGSNFFEGLYQQNPIDMDRAEIKPNKFKYWDSSKDNREFGYSDTVIAVDPAGERFNKGSDNSAIVCVSQGTDERIYIRGHDYGGWNTDEFMRNLFKMQETFKCAVKFETIGMQAKLCEMVRKEMMIRKVFFSIIEVKSHGKGITKNDRIRSTLIPYYENGRILHEESMKSSYFEEEIIRFPRGKRDDIIDALEMAVSHFKTMSSEVSPQQEDTEYSQVWNKFTSMMYG